ncbi:hypothetical protein ABZ490_51575 [Streptomyces sp. NPDC005811]|uniref:hypothetical protein n=1 Tax=Streptomyces sp. NPDC005811 TaxID=3154565 RepID=UPI0033E9DE26
MKTSTPALARELQGELGLGVARAEAGGLLWVIDQRIARPGLTPPLRKLHLIYRLHVTGNVRAALAEQELDGLPDASHEVGVIEWVDHCKAAGLPVFPPVFPPVGPALAALAGPRAPSSAPPWARSPTRTAPGYELVATEARTDVRASVHAFAGAGQAPGQGVRQQQPRNHGVGPGLGYCSPWHGFL